MNWEAIGAIGEIIGAVGVIASLFYVAYQVRQSTNQTKLNTLAIATASSESIRSAGNDIRLKLAENPELARLYLKGNKDPSLLSDEEKLSYRMFLGANVSNFFIVYESQQKGLNEYWEGTQVHAQRLLNHPGGRWYWEYSKKEFTPNFQKAVDDLLAEFNNSDSVT